MTADYYPIFFNGKKNLPFFENVIMFTKLHEPINQGIRPVNLDRRKRLTWQPSSNIDLKNRVADFLAHASVTFLQDDKVCKRTLCCFPLIYRPTLFPKCFLPFLAFL